jgi:integrase
MGRKKVVPVGKFHDINETFVERAIFPSDCEHTSYIYRDNELVGFALRVSKTGRKTFIVEAKSGVPEYDEQGKKKKPRQKQEKIGLAGPGGYTAKAAREQAERWLSAYRTGSTVNAAKTVRWALNDYVDVGSLSDETVKSMKKCINAYFGPYLDRLMQSFGYEECRLIYEDVFRNGGKDSQGVPTQANLMKRYLQAIFEYNHIIPNPWHYVRVSAPPQVHKKAVLEASEIKQVWYAVQDARPLPRDAMFTLLFTGFRHRAIRFMEWKYLDLEKCVYRIAEKAEGFKNGPAVEYPLPVWLIENVLRRRHALYHDKSPYVFPNRVDPNRPMDNVRGTYQKIGKQIGTHLSTYVFRRTRATFTESFFGTTLITQRFLNHRVKVAMRDAPATGYYTKASTRMLRRYAEAYCSIIRQLAGELPMSEKVKQVVLDEHADVRQQTVTLEEVDAMLDTRALDVLAPEPDDNDLAADRLGAEMFEFELTTGAPSSADEEDEADD